MRSRANISRKQHLLRRRFIILVTLALILLAGSFVFFARHAGESERANSSTTTGRTVQTPLQCATQLPLKVLVGQVLMVGLPAREMADQAPIFNRYHVGGAVIMTSPANPHDGSITVFKQSALSTHIPLLISTDEEGGIVQRFATLGVLPSPKRVAATMTVAQAQQLIAGHAAKLKAIGIDMVLGPLVDVAPAHSQSPLGSRVFSSDPATVSDYALAYIRGWQSAGLVPTLKHFPGMGSASGNTDYRPATTPPLGTLMQRDFVPYKTLASGNAAVMIGNQTVPGWFSGPASLSPTANTYLRSKLGYKDDLVVTDSLLARAITATTPLATAVVRAIAAGNDIAIIVDPDAAAITTRGNQGFIVEAETALQNAVANGTLSRKQLAASVVRKLKLQDVEPCTLLK